MATQRSFSDPELENISPSLDLVSFEGVAPCYSAQDDIVVQYRLGGEVSPTRQDWVGLFRDGWGTTEDYLIYAWAPAPTHPDRGVIVTFPANQLQALPTDGRHFQFLFVSRGNYVAGVSRMFRLSGVGGQGSSGSSSASSCLTVSDNCSFSLVGSDASLDTQGFEDIADLVEKTPSSTESFELTCQSSSSLLISQLFAIPGEESAPELTTPTCSSTHVPSGEEAGHKTSADNLGEQDVQAPSKITRDTVTLSGNFPEKITLGEKLRFVDQHPLVQDYMANKETSLVPYVPVFRLQQSGSEKSLKKSTKGKKAVYRNLPMVPFNPSVGASRSWIWLEVMPMCCALCTSARSLMEVYRRQLAISASDLKELKLDVTCLRKTVDLQEDQIAVHRRRELKFTETEDTIEEVIIQVSCLKNDINNLLIQNSTLENERNKLQARLDACQRELAECQTKYTNAESQLNDVLFSLSLRGYSSLIDFTDAEYDMLAAVVRKGLVDITSICKNINLSKVEGKPTQLDGWQLYKNKRCGRLLAIINQQEQNIKSLQTKLTEKDEDQTNLQSDLNSNQRVLQMAKTQVASLMDEVIQLKCSLELSMKREESSLRLLANAEVELSQSKYEAETREHHLLQQIRELKETLSKRAESSVMASTQRLVSTGLAKVTDVCKPSWCAGLCPIIGKSSNAAAAIPPESSLVSTQPQNEQDSISWENEEPAAKQAKVSGTKKACKRSHKETVAKERPQAKSVHQRRRSNFPDTCPVCGVSFAAAVDNRVIDEHLAFHDVYRV